MSRFWRRSANTAPLLATQPFDLLCLTIGVVLAEHAAHQPWWLSLLLALVLLWRWQQRRRRGGRTPGWLKLGAVALLLAALLLHYGNLFSREAGSAMVVGMLVLKLLESEHPRDARVGAAFACFALMSALLLDQGLLATLVVALGLLPALATLRSLQPAPLPPSLTGELWPALRLLAVALPIALLAFVLIPRLSTPLWGAPNRESTRTGLSDHLQPGDFTELLTDDSPALRVSFDGAPPAAAQRYFRAYVMTLFDGRGWREDPRSRWQPAAALQASRPLSYQVSLEPNQQRVLPALDMPIDAPAKARLLADHQLLAERPVNDPIAYRLSSASVYQLQPALDAANFRRSTALPAGSNPRSVALARQWRQRYGDHPEAIAQAALALFHDGGFGYSLAPPPLGSQPVDDFLFATRLGYCEHYASAFAVLMRAAGIPARVVTGYQGGYWNRLGNYLLVRQSDAHAWDEIWLAGRGWVRYDPTAAVRPERVSLGAAAAAGDQAGWSERGWLREWRNHWDVVNRWWNQGVIGFDALRQRGLLKPFGIQQVDTGTLSALLAASTVVFALLGLGWALRRRGKRDRRAELMRLIERKLGRVGLPRRAGEGPQHYFKRMARALPAQRNTLESLAAQYLQVTYAQDVPDAESLRALYQAVKDFRPRRVYK